MSTLLHVVLWVIIAAVALWALIFGGIGVAIARVRGKPLWSGFGWGFCLGPIGWLLLVFDRHRVHGGSDEHIGIDTERPETKRHTDIRPDGSENIPDVL